jgi:L-iditol 2-dehydrogenase
MKAALLYGKQDLRFEEVQLPELESHAMLLKMRASGICGSDSRVYFNGLTSRYINPVILGHELSAEVAQVGSGVEGYQPGDLVTIAPVIPCMRCNNCAHGQDNICENAGVIGCTVHGGMAEYLYIPSQMVLAGGIVKLPQDVDYHAGALSELVGVSLHGWRQAGLEAGDRVMILGSGPIGMTFLQLARLKGAAWVGLTGHRAHRLSIAQELGAQAALEAGAVNLEAEYGATMDRVVVATSNVQALRDALKIIRPGGSLLLFSGYLPQTTLEIALNDIHYRELHIHGSIDCTIEDFQHAVSLLPQLDMGKLINRTYPLEEAEAAFQATRERSVVKVMFEL